MTLEKATVHGVESFGMILSESELGLSDNADEIAVLPTDVKPGMPLEKIVDFRDTVIELEITPNRPDCLSHLGIAREIQALGGGRLTYPETAVVEADELASDTVRITIDDPSGCPRYTGRVIRDVRIGPSPLWLKTMVYYLGMRPINNVVDITNYVMLELGHPLHAFDYDLFSRPEVLVRRASAGEKFVTLDGIKRELNREHLLITDGSVGVAIAGIMGGEKSEVSPETGNILLESAYFNPAMIRRGSKGLGLVSESSKRFERGADPEMAPVANDRACRLISQLAQGRVLKGLVDEYPEKFVPVDIELRPSRANGLLGIEIPAKEMVEILNNLGVDSSVNHNIKARQPSFRPDLTREIDLVEEIARIHGLDNIPPVFRSGGTMVTPESRFLSISGKTRSYLAGAGAIEVFPMTLVDSAMTEKFGLTEKSVSIINPLSEEMAVVRPNLILSMLPIIKRNMNFKENDLFLFEIGNYYISGGKGKLPSQKTALIITQTGSESPVFWDGKSRPRDLFTLRGVIEDLADFHRMGTVDLKPAPHFAFEPTRSFELYIGGSAMGYMGLVSPNGCSIADIKGDIYIAEIDFDRFAEAVPESMKTSDLARFPSADRDISVVVDDSVKAEEIRRSIIENGEGLVSDVWIFDLFRGKNIQSGKKSLAFGIKYRLPDRTLTDEEVDEVHGNIARVLEEEFGAKLRS
jgi:phenylalanyl-tRNA synthetase beta chain